MLLPSALIESPQDEGSHLGDIMSGHRQHRRNPASAVGNIEGEGEGSQYYFKVWQKQPQGKQIQVLPFLVFVTIISFHLLA